MPMLYGSRCAGGGCTGRIEETEFGQTLTVLTTQNSPYQYQVTQANLRQVRTA